MEMIVGPASSENGRVKALDYVSEPALIDFFSLGCLDKDLKSSISYLIGVMYVVLCCFSCFTDKCVFVFWKFCF